MNTESHTETSEIGIAGKHRVNVSRERLWESLNDPEVLQQCIKGCDHVEKVHDDEFCAIFKVRIGPLKKAFSAKLFVVDALPPDRYHLVSSMDAGFAGRLNGTADVHLGEVGKHETELRYKAKVKVEGWLGEIGMKLLGSTAERYMQRFFNRLVAIINNQEL